MTPLTTERPVWPAWRKIAFRFAFIYLMLHITPWSLASGIPWVRHFTQYYDMGWDWIIRFFNTHLFRVADNLVTGTGSSDTSFAWAELLFLLCFSVVATAIWTVLDRRRKDYESIDYWLRICVRYYLAFNCFAYAVVKLFTVQMGFPTLSQLATPLGDFLPMRFSWLFIGYSTPYQVFSGIMELVAGLLLLNRKTVTLGLIMATGVFLHVVVLNLSYDIPVKLHAIHLLILCIYLLSYEMKRLINFFILNRPAEPDTFFNVTFESDRARYGRIIAKGAFIIIALVMPLYGSYERYSAREARTALKPIKIGVYDVDLYVVDKDTIPALISNKQRWNEVILDIDGLGSMKNIDTTFHERYNRSYFFYKPDTIRKIIEFRDFSYDSLPQLTMKYKMPDENTIQLWSLYHGDSLFMQLRRTERHFQLAEKQFHWLTEYNR